MENLFKRIDRTGTGSEKWAIMPDCVREKGGMPLSVADMEVPTAPVIIDAMVDAAKHGIVGYTGPDAAYLSAFAGWLKRHHNYEIAPEAVSCTFGVVAALNVCIRTFTKPGDGIIIQTPVYPPFHNAVKQNGRVLVENPLKNDGGYYTMDFEDLKAKAADPNNKLLILCSPHNPIGRVWTVEELTELGRICKENGVLIISDEIHYDLALTEEKPHHMFGSLGKEFEDNCVMCTALSKTFNLAGLHCSNIIIPNEELRKQYLSQVAIEGFSGIPYFAYKASIAAYTKADDWYFAMLDFIRENGKACTEHIAKRIPKAVVSPLEGTYLLWVDLTFLGLTGDAFNDFLCAKAGICVNNGCRFGIMGDGFIRINLATELCDLIHAIDCLADAIERR